MLIRLKIGFDFRSTDSASHKSQSLSFLLLMVENILLSLLTSAEAKVSSENGKEWKIGAIVVVIVLSILSWVFQILYYKLGHPWKEINYSPIEASQKTANGRETAIEIEMEERSVSQVSHSIWSHSDLQTNSFYKSFSLKFEYETLKDRKI